MQERFIELVFAFQAAVREAVALLEKHLGLSTPMYWRQVGIPQSGFADPEKTIRYFFHGVGCGVEWPGGSVDWDFGHDGRIDGFDEWHLWMFAECDTEHFPEFKDKTNLKAAFQKAVKSGLISQPFLQSQYYLYYQHKADAD